MTRATRGSSGPDEAGGGSSPLPRGSANFQETYPAVADSVSVARAALVAFVRRSRVAQDRIDAIALAASEAMTNVVVHAYRDADAPGSLDVSAALAGGELWVIVTDRGSGLKPRRDSPGLGLGLAIIARVADGVDLLKPSAGGLELRMRFEVRA
jgi:anti-sigma regulatory factor (Ser/Thr protein kinase)